MSRCLSMPCKLSPCLIPLANADAVGDGVEVDPHHVQLVGLEHLAQSGPEDVLVAVFELDDDLTDAVRVDAPRHVERATVPLPVSSLQAKLPSIQTSAPRRGRHGECYQHPLVRAAIAGTPRRVRVRRGGREACWRPEPP